MFLQTSINHLFIFLFTLPLSMAYYPKNTIEDCDYGNGIYTEDSFYHQNLNNLLSSLSDSTPTTGYFNDTRGSNGPNQVFGLAMCRGDLQLTQDCTPCLEYAVSEIDNLCPNKKNAAVLFDECFLRYGDENFFGRPTGNGFYNKIGMNISKDPEQFAKVRAKLLSELLVQATDGTSSPSLFAAGRAVVSSEISVFALLQCTRDLSTKDCNKCLKVNIDLVSTTNGSMFLGKSCFLRYGTDLFYNEPSLLPPASPPETSDDTEGNTISTEIIAMIAAMGILMVAMGFGFWLWRKRNRDRHHKTNESQNELPQIPYQDVEYLSMKFMDLERATHHFSEENKVGQGGFGSVYKGILNKQEIAVKRLRDKNSLHGPAQLEKEVTILAKLQHNNLVRLIGYCIEEDEMLLVYEYLSNNSLEKHLFDHIYCKGVLNWTTRLNIIEGIVKGIQYLHEDSRLKIFHRDLKPENILLDKDMTPKISDFGISKYFDANRTQGSTTENIIGTRGYMAPEYRMYGGFSTKSDIYSLGVMLLEILTGKRWSRQSNFSEHSRNLKSYISASGKNGRLADILDKNVLETYTRKQEKTLSNILHIATLCVEYDPELRPKISDVLPILRSDYIKLSNNSSLQMSHMPGSSGSNTDDSNPSFLATQESTRAMTNDGLR